MLYLDFKNIILPLSAGLLISLAGCSDENELPVGNLSDKTYTASSGLELYYNGVEMPGKSVSFSHDGISATLKGFSTFDMSQLSGFGLTGELPCPGIIPGSVETVWNVPLKEEGGFMVFSGSDSNGICSYNYNGKFNPDKLIINITDAVLTDHPLSKTAWQPAPIKKESDGSYSSLPVYIDWEIDPLPEIDLNLSEIIKDITVLPVIPVYNNTAYMSISEALTQVLKATSFRADGNILLTYISTTGGAASLAQTQANGLQYAVADDGTINLFINPLSLFGFILENTSGSTPPEDVDLTGTGLYPSGSSTSTGNSSLSSLLSSPITQAVAKALLDKILPQIATGIPLSYTLTDQQLDVYIDTPTSLSIIQTVIDAVIENEEVMKVIIGELEKDEQLAPIVQELPKLQQFVQEVLTKTTKFRIGFAFVPL